MPIPQSKPVVNPFRTPSSKTTAAVASTSQTLLIFFFFSLQTFAASPCINGGIFHHQNASGAEANGINSSAACQEPGEEGRRHTGSRWGQSSSITPCQQQPQPVHASWFRWGFPHPCLVLLALPLRRCLLPAIPLHFPLLSCKLGCLLAQLCDFWPISSLLMNI